MFHRTMLLVTLFESTRYENIGTVSNCENMSIQNITITINFHHSPIKYFCYNIYDLMYMIPDTSICWTSLL